MFWSVGWPLLRAEGFFCILDILYGGLGIGKLQFYIKIFFFFSCNFFQFLSLKPWIRIGSGSGLVFSLKWWIRIRMKWMRIRNPALNHERSLLRYLLKSGCCWQCRIMNAYDTWTPALWKKNYIFIKRNENYTGINTKIDIRIRICIKTMQIHNTDSNLRGGIGA